MSSAKKQLFEQLALIAHTLGSPQRVELVYYMAQAERSVEELSHLAGLTVANTSRHLQILKHNGLAISKKKGKSRLYHLAGDDVVKLVSSLRDTAELHLAEVERLKSSIIPPEYSKQTISSQDLVGRLRDQDLLILDVRPNKEFLEGHIKGAININPDEIEEKTKNLPKGKTVIAYCRGPYCVYSYEMIDSLRSQGVEALKLEDGFPEWKAAGLPYEGHSKG